jgi:hypothetical protein
MPPLSSGRSAATAVNLLVGLSTLADAMDELAIAVERHDLAALLAANERAERLIAEVDAAAAALTPADRAVIDPFQLAALRERIAIGARRNAYLIERAWALDAATIRLLASLGRGSDGAPVHGAVPGAGLPGDATPVHGYGAGPAPAAYVDRQA